MTRDEVIQAMHKVGAIEGEPLPLDFAGCIELFQRFAWLVATKELADCANELERCYRNDQSEAYRKAIVDCVRLIRQLADVNSLSSLPGGLKGKGLKL